MSTRCDCESLLTENFLTRRVELLILHANPACAWHGEGK